MIRIRNPVQQERRPKRKQNKVWQAERHPEEKRKLQEEEAGDEERYLERQNQGTKWCPVHRIRKPASGARESTC